METNLDYKMERINQNGIYEITIPNVKEYDAEVM